MEDWEIEPWLFVRNRASAFLRRFASRGELVSAVENVGE